jgi:hypothetical protein
VCSDNIYSFYKFLYFRPKEVQDYEDVAYEEAEFGLEREEDQASDISNSTKTEKKNNKLSKITCTIKQFMYTFDKSVL